MSLKRTLAKALIGVALVSSLYGLPTKKANALEMIYPSGLVMIYPEKTNKQTNLYKQNNTNKQKKEFIPPELPYCRIVRADGTGIVIDYYPEDYNKTHKAYTLRWAVNNINWYTVGGASVDLIYTAGYNVELGARDKAFIQEYLIKAAREVLANCGWSAGNYGAYELVLKRTSGKLFDNYYIRFKEPSY